MAITTGALLGAAGIGAASNIFSGLFGSRSQDKANKANIQMQRETNEMNERLFHESQAFQEDMWNKTNAYNDPSAVVERYQKAGINPAEAFGSGEPSLASMPSSPSAPTMESPKTQPIDYSWMNNVVDQGVNAFLNNQILSNQVTKSAADAQIAKVGAEFDAMTLQYRAMKVMNDAKASEHEKDIARLTMEVLEGTKKNNILQSDWAVKIQEKTYDELVNKIAIQELEKQAMTIANQYAPQLNDAQLGQLKAGMVNLYASAANQNAQALESAARKLLVDMQKEGQNLSNEQVRKMTPLLVDQARETVYKLEDERFERPLNYYRSHLGRAAQNLLTPGAATSAATYMNIQEKRGRLTGRGYYYPRN